MKPLDISPDFTIEDMTKNMTRQEKKDYYNERGRKVQRILEEMKESRQ